MRSIKDKVMVITGASRGIGAGIARLFAEEQAKLVLCGRDQQRLKEVAESLPIPKANRLTVAVDITKKTGMKKIVEAAYKKYGVVDIFINNAGVGARKLLVDLTEREFDAVMAVNLKAVFYSFKEIIPRFQKQGFGQIINISSMAGKQGVAGMAAYCASKAALNVFSEAVANEVRNDNIKISVLAPGSTDTGFMAGGSKKKGVHPREKNRMTTAEVAEAVLFMARQNENAWMSLAEIRPLIIKK